MTQERNHVLALATGVAALALALSLDASPVTALAAGVVYAVAAYFTAAHSDVVFERGDTNWAGGAFGGGLSLGALGMVVADVEPGILLLGFGLCCFGFVAGIAYVRETNS